MRDANSKEPVALSQIKDLVQVYLSEKHHLKRLAQAGMGYAPLHKVATREEMEAPAIARKALWRVLRRLANEP